MLLLMFYYASVILPLKQNFNTTLLFIIRYLYGPTDEYATRQLLIETMFRSNKRQRIGKPPQGVSIRTRMNSVQESGYVVVMIKTKTAMTQRDKSRSVLQAKLAALEMRAPYEGYEYIRNKG